MVAWRSKILTVLVALAFGSAASATDFRGYFAPAVLVSNMQNNLMYSPVGMGEVTSKAGFRVHPVTGHGDFHNGVDLAARLNDKVYCLLDGVVTRVGWRGNLGVAVEIYHPYPNVRTIVGHLNAYSVRPGEPVMRGRVIGYAGTTGRSTGVHVHYTVIKEDTNEYIEPYMFIKQVPQYVMQLRTVQAQMMRNQNMRSYKQKLDNNLIETTAQNTDDLPEGKPGKEKDPPSSMEP